MLRAGAAAARALLRGGVGGGVGHGGVAAAARLSVSSPASVRCAPFVTGPLSLAVQRARHVRLEPLLLPVAHAEAMERRARLPRQLSADGLQKSSDAPTEMSLMQLLREIWDLIDLAWLSATVATALATAVVGVLLPRATGRLVDALTRLVRGERAELSSAALGLAVLSLANAVLTFCYISTVSVVGERLAERLRVRLFDALIRQDILFFDRAQTGDLLARLTSDVQEFKHAVKGLVAQGVKAATQTALGIASLVAISLPMSGALVLSLPAIYSVGSLYGAYLRRLSAETRSADAAFAAHAGERLGGIRTVRAFAMEDAESDHFASLARTAARLHERQGAHIGAFQGLTNLSFSGLFLGILWLGGSLVGDGRLAAGDLMNFLMTTQATQKSLGALVALLGTAGKALGAGARALEYASRSPAVPIRGGETIPAGDLRGEIRFERVDFAYATRPEQTVLASLDLCLTAGKVTAVCGPSGGGKSTMAALIERFYEPTAGALFLDDRPLALLDPSWLRSQIGYISQEPVLFATSIRENIRYGRPTASDAEIEAAARKANAHAFICGFPEGYSTRVGERGLALSGGQRQRIAIARAILKDPKILILDEATSALDAESERLVQAALDELMRGRTVLVIAHRLSTLHNADEIAVMHPREKRIIETGTHAQLMARESFYRALYTQMQTTGGGM